MRSPTTKSKALVVGIAAIVGTTLGAAVSASTVAPTTSIDEARRSIAESERAWADAVVTGDTGAVERALAPDFVGVDDSGNRYNKATMVDAIRSAPQEYVTNRFDNVDVRVYGTYAIAQGSETWTRRSLTPTHGRFVFTDTWAFRDGKWQAVAGQYLVPADAPVDVGVNTRQ